MSEAPVFYQVDFVHNVQFHHVTVRFRTTEFEPTLRKYVAVHLNIACILATGGLEIGYRVSNDKHFVKHADTIVQEIISSQTDAAAAAAWFQGCVFEWHRNRHFFDSMQELFQFVETQFGKRFVITHETILDYHTPSITTNFKCIDRKAPTVLTDETVQAIETLQVTETVEACILLAKRAFLITEKNKNTN